jgi:SAM-dependent methyltransferase
MRTLIIIVDSNNHKSRRIPQLHSMFMDVGRFFYWIIGICMEKFSLGYLALALTYKDTTPNQRAMEYGWVLSNLWKIKGRKILDVGAGVGPFAFVARRSGYDVTPIDKRRLPNDVTVLPCANDSFDGATLISVI